MAHMPCPFPDAHTYGSAILARVPYTTGDNTNDAPHGYVGIYCKAKPFNGTFDVSARKPRILGNSLLALRFSRLLRFRRFGIHNGVISRARLFLEVRWIQFPM